MQKWNHRFLELAEHVAQWSKDPSTKCGAVIVRPDKTIASVGFNGFPRNIRDSSELLHEREEKYKRVVHAEMNALLFLREPARGFSIYTWPMLPCERCMVHIVQAGIVQVFAPKTDEQRSSRWPGELTRELCREARIDLYEI